MAGNRDERWYFTPDVLENSPSRKSGMDADRELSHRQQAANLIQGMGQWSGVTQLCINTAIVYMHRFYVFHSFMKYHRTSIAACALFLAAKVEEQPRKLEVIIKALIQVQHPNHPVDVQAEAAKLVKNENVMLQTLGFDIAIEHPHTFVVKCCQMVRAPKDLAQTCYFMATNSLHLTTMCLKYKPTLVACACIHLACKWSSWQIPESSEGKRWWEYVDAAVTIEQLEELTKEFLAILDKCPSRLKRKIMAGGGQGSGSDTLPPNPSSESNNNSSQSTDFQSGDSEHQSASARTPVTESRPSSSSSSSAPKPEAVSASVPSVPVASSAPIRMSPGRFHPPAAKERQSYSVYKEKKEQERREHERKDAEKNEAERKRAAAEKAERDRRLEAERRVAAEQQREQERLDRERRQQEIQRRELEQREAERRAEADRREKERREKEIERREAEKREAERRETERREAEKREAERRAEADRREQERLVAEKVAAEQREADRREAELIRQREEELKRLEDDRRRQEAERQQESVPVHDDVKREAEKKNRFFTSRSPATATEPDSRPPAPPSFDDLVAKTRSEDLIEKRVDGDRRSPHKHHKSPKSHKRKKSKHHHQHKDKHKDRDKSRDKRHDKHEAEPLPIMPPIKLKIKPLHPAADPLLPPQLPADPPAESFKIRIAKDRLLNHSSTPAAADSDSSRKRKNSFEAASISKKPVL